jgi:hypothetical protein
MTKRLIRLDGEMSDSELGTMRREAPLPNRGRNDGPCDAQSRGRWGHPRSGYLPNITRPCQRERQSPSGARESSNRAPDDVSHYNCVQTAFTSV